MPSPTLELSLGKAGSNVSPSQALYYRYNVLHHHIIRACPCMAVAVLDTSTEFFLASYVALMSLSVKTYFFCLPDNYSVMWTALAWHKLHQQGYAIEQGAAHGSRHARPCWSTTRMSAIQDAAISLILVAPNHQVTDAPIN